ncbi:MAG: restriction endonuclease [Nitrospirota bacterium]
MELSNAFYIKLGRGGQWEADSIASGKLRFGWAQQSLTDINSANWAIIEQQLRQELGASAGQAARALNGLKIICSSTSSDIWITFHQSKLWWARLSDQRVAQDDISKYRTPSSPWSDRNLKGKLLVATELPGKLAQLQGFRWTVCTVHHKDILQRVLEGTSSPRAQAVAHQRALLAAQLTEAIQELHWKDFEILVDLVFRASGWIRVSVLGEQAKGYDLELREPITDDRYVVQVKSRAGLRELAETSAQFSPGDYRRVFFVVHTPDPALAQADDIPDHVELIPPEALAERAIDAGLTSWIEEKLA